MREETLFKTYKEDSISGRYLSLNHIEPLLKSIGKVASVVGNSVLGEPIYACNFGSGKTKILMWSQMHGNESTTTKALFDLINLLQSDSPEAKAILQKFTLYIVPMLNPDGANLYTRENANSIDLNRDFCDLTQPESRLLFEIFSTFKPNYCFNLHDQRTIYGVGHSEKPATVSFLAPSFNEAREFNETRVHAINVIAAMNDKLQEIIPGQVGRFDDSFNLNCVGDTFQFHNVPTILFEAGHFPNDYEREETRKCIFISLLTALENISENVVVNNRIADYLNIPQNNINFYDFVYKNVKINYDGKEIITNFASQFTEAIVDGKVEFSAMIAEVGISDAICGHVVFDAKNAVYKDEFGNKPEINNKADFYLGNVKFVNGKKVQP